MKTLFRVILCIMLIPAFASSQPAEVDVPLSISDGAGGSVQLRFGLDPLATDGIDASLGEEEQPPMPPTGAFAARFVGADLGQGVLRDYRQGGGNTTGTRIHELQYQPGAGTTITISWNLPTGVSGRLQDIITGSLIDEQMTGSGEFVVSNPGGFSRLQLTVTYALASSARLLLYMTGISLSTPGRRITTELFDSGGSLLATQVGALDSNVYPMVFDDIVPQSGCSYRVWLDTVSPDEIFGREYLGGGRNLDFSSGSMTNIFSRSTPITTNITIVDSITGRTVRGDTTEVGRRLRVRLYTDVPSGSPPPPGPQRYYGTEVLDRDKTLPYDFDLKSDYYIGGDTVFTFHITPVATGDYFGVAGCILDLDGVPTTTEGGRWVSGPLFTVVPSYVAPPASPELVSPANGSALGESFVAVWQKVSDAESYEFELASDSLFTSVVLTTTLADTTLNVTHGGQVGTRFWWRVRAYGNSKWGLFGDPWSLKFLIFPTAVQLLSPQNGLETNADSVVALWHRSAPEVDSYNYQLSQDSLFGSLVLDSATGDTSVALKGLTDGRYWLRVRAQNARGWGTFGDARWFTKTSLSTPPPVALVDPPDNFMSEQNRLTMKWSEPASGILKYMLEVATNNLFVNAAVDSSITADSSTIEGLTLGQQYWWRVRAKNVAGWGPPSPAWKFMYLSRPPAVALNSPAAGAILSADTVRVSWVEAQPMVDRYWCEIASDSLFNLKAVDSLVVGGSYVFRSLVGLKYWWRVRAHNAAGWGEFSVARSFTVSITDVTLGPDIPTELRLFPNYPNPFNPSTQIRYALPIAGEVSLVVFNSAGQEVAKLLREKRQPGVYTVRWDASGMPSGVYFYRLTAGEYVQTRKAVLMK